MMDVSGAYLELIDESADDGGFEDGVVSASTLIGNFDFVRVGSDVSSMCMWPHGSCIVVRFPSTGRFVDVYPVLTVPQLPCVSVIHGFPSFRKEAKQEYVRFLRLHACDERCSVYSTYVFNARKVARRRQRTVATGDSYHGQSVSPFAI